MVSINEKLFGNFDHRRTLTDPDFKEDSVREVIIAPILKELGYRDQDIVRSKSLHHPYLKIGSKSRPITLIPDYALKVEDHFAWVLDAKSPKEGVNDEGNIEQVYCYATHPDIRSTYFALCNGVEFSLYRRESTNQPILCFQIDEIQYHWEELTRFLSPASFQVGKRLAYETTTATAKKRSEFDYKDRPLLEEIPVRKQEAKRHFGVHGYFTKQSWNVVAEYIKNFTKQGDTVLDPFGGSGVTAIEALMNNRKAISIDINPLAVFMVKTQVCYVKQIDLSTAYTRVIKDYEINEPKSNIDIAKILKNTPYPKGNQLPASSDVSNVEELFTLEQLAKLALLKSIIRKEPDPDIKNLLLLAFSSTVNKFNLTFHYTESPGGGDSAPFRYYRYRLAPRPGKLNLIDIF